MINTRFMDPSAYGDVRYVQNIINFISSLVLFGFFFSGSRLLALSHNESYSRRIRGAMVCILGAAALIVVLGCVTCFFIHYPRQQAVAWLFIVSIPVCFSPIFLNYINTTAQGDNHIYRLSIARLLPALIYVPIAFYVYSRYGATPRKMILLQWGAATLVLGGVILSTRPSFKELKPIFSELSNENKEYGFQLYLGSLVMVATNYIAGITLGYFGSDNTMVGYYTLALTVTSPLTTLPAIIGTSYFKAFATQPMIPPRVLKNTLFITLISCLLFIVLIRPTVDFLYTSKYEQVGIYASWLAVGFCIHGYGDMINRYLGSHGKGKEIRNASIFNGVFKLLGYTFLVYSFGIYGAILTTLMCDCLYTGCLVYYYLNFLKNNESPREL